MNPSTRPSPLRGTPGKYSTPPPCHGFLHAHWRPLARFVSSLTLAPLLATVAPATEASDAESRVASGERVSLPAEEDHSTRSPIQAKARPFGLEIVDQVQLGGSDESSTRFQREVLPSLTGLVNQTLSERTGLRDGSMMLDPARLILATESDVRVYFIGEGAGYHNSLGFDTSGRGLGGRDARLIFPDASSNISTYEGGASGRPVRTPSEPLLPGDFVNLGRFAAGSSLDFFLVSNGASGSGPVFTSNPKLNPDGINHMASFAYARADSPLLVISFEDMLGGGDRDFNDLVFAVDIGAANVHAITAAPEPRMALGAAALGLVALAGRRRSPAMLPA